MPIRVHQLAKELKIENKELIEKLAKLGVKVKSHMANIDDETYESIKAKLSPKKAESKKTVAKKEVIKKVEIKKAEPKIIEPIRQEIKKPEAKKAEVKHVEVKKPESVKIVEQPKPVEIKKPEPMKAEVKPVEIPRPFEPEIVIAAKDMPLYQVKIPITVKELATRISTSPTEIIKRLMKKGFLVNINQNLNEEILRLIGNLFGVRIERLPTAEEELIHDHKEEVSANLAPRPPIVTFMGHVDHGKTSLLDAIRNTKVTEREVGGITQHVGAYEVILPKGKITFLDTPGHEAFTAMRARGANLTDIVVLVVAADDGIMPQTIEAIDHAKAADVPIIVALNKSDLPTADPDRVKKQLSSVGLLAEDWGGKTICVPVSAKTGMGIDNLLEMILLLAEIMELKADPAKKASGIVIEGELSKGSGPIAHILVSSGTLAIGDPIVCGAFAGKVKAMIDDKGKRLKEAPPSTPVEVLGLEGVPKAGDLFFVTQDERTAKQISESRQEKLQLSREEPVRHISLDELYSIIKEGKLKELKLVIKADVAGSLEALVAQLNKLPTQDIKLSVIHAAIGEVNDSDIILAMASNAIVIGFHVRISDSADEKARHEGVDVRFYRIIFEAVNDIIAAMEGILEPRVEEIFIGRALVKQVFKVTKAGIVAGSMIEKGKAVRNANFKLIRDKNIIAEGKIPSLKRFKDDVSSVETGFECGITLGDVKDVQAGDLIEFFEIRKTARKL